MPKQRSKINNIFLLITLFTAPFSYGELIASKQVLNIKLKDLQSNHSAKIKLKNDGDKPIWIEAIDNKQYLLKIALSNYLIKPGKEITLSLDYNLVPILSDMKGEFEIFWKPADKTEKEAEKRYMLNRFLKERTGKPLKISYNIDSPEVLKTIPEDIVWLSDGNKTKPHIIELEITNKTLLFVKRVDNKGLFDVNIIEKKAGKLYQLECLPPKGEAAGKLIGPQLIFYLEDEKGDIIRGVRLNSKIVSNHHLQKMLNQKVGNK